MGSYQICNFCDNLFEMTNNKMCQDCLQSYKKIRSVVENTSGITVLEVSSQTGISTSKIRAFAQNGYFIMSEGGIEAKD